MAELTPEQIAANEDKVLKESQAAELKKQHKTEALRELSKKFGIDAFKPEEIESKFNEFTQWQTDQKSEQEILQGKVEAFELKETDWQTKELDYQIKIEAGRLGIDKDNLDDAMALAGNNPSKLEEVIKKYPIFKSKKVMKIGIHQGDKTLDGLTEAEEYMAKNYKDSPYVHKK